MVTVFGKHLRKMRVDLDENLKQMAINIGVSSSYLSAIELGKKNVASTTIDTIVKRYKLDQSDHNKLQDLADKSRTSLTIDLSMATETDRLLVLSFAKNFKQTSPQNRSKMLALMT